MTQCSQRIYEGLHQQQLTSLILIITTLLPSPVWSDDDWLKKFSGKTAEEADAEAAGGGEATNTASQEVTRIFF